MGASQSTETPSATSTQAPSTTPVFDGLQAEFDALVGSCEKELDGFSECSKSMAENSDDEAFRTACRDTFEVMAYCMQLRQTRATAIGGACGDYVASYQRCMISNAPGAAATDDAESSAAIAAASGDFAGATGVGACVPSLRGLLECAKLAVEGKVKHSSLAPGADDEAKIAAAAARS